MAYQAGAQPAPMERAQELGAEILRNMRPGDRAALLLAGSQTRLITPLVLDASAVPVVLGLVQEAAKVLHVLGADHGQRVGGICGDLTLAEETYAHLDADYDWRSPIWI